MTKFMILEEISCFNCDGTGRHFTEEAEAIEATLQRGIKEMTACTRPQLSVLTRAIGSLNGLLQGYSSGEDLTEECKTCKGKGYRHNPIPLTSDIVEQIRAAVNAEFHRS